MWSPCHLTPKLRIREEQAGPQLWEGLAFLPPPWACDDPVHTGPLCTRGDPAHRGLGLGSTTRRTPPPRPGAPPGQRRARHFQHIRYRSCRDSNLGAGARGPLEGSPSLLRPKAHTKPGQVTPLQALISSARNGDNVSAAYLTNRSQERKQRHGRLEGEKPIGGLHGRHFCSRPDPEHPRPGPRPSAPERGRGKIPPDSASPAPRVPAGPPGPRKSAPHLPPGASSHRAADRIPAAGQSARRSSRRRGGGPAPGPRHGNATLPAQSRKPGRPGQRGRLGAGPADGAARPASARAFSARGAPEGRGADRFPGGWSSL